MRVAEVRPAKLVEWSLAVSINKTPYRVEPLRVDRRAARRGFALCKSDGTTYHVAQTTHGCECTCPDFVYRRDGIDPLGCKHIQALDLCELIETGRNP